MITHPTDGIERRQSSKSSAKSKRKNEITCTSPPPHLRSNQQSISTQYQHPYDITGLTYRQIEILKCTRETGYYSVKILYNESKTVVLLSSKRFDEASRNDYVLKELLKEFPHRIMVGRYIDGKTLLSKEAQKTTLRQGVVHHITITPKETNAMLGSDQTLLAPLVQTAILLFAAPGLVLPYLIFQSFTLPALSTLYLINKKIYAFCPDFGKKISDKDSYFSLAARWCLPLIYTVCNINEYHHKVCEEIATSKNSDTDTSLVIMDDLLFVHEISRILCHKHNFTRQDLDSFSSDPSILITGLEF